MIKNQARKILFDLVIPVVALTMIAIFFFLQHRGYQSHGADYTDDTFIDQDSWEAIQDKMPAKRIWQSGRKAMLLYNSNDEDSVQTYEQICFVLESIGADVTCRRISIAVEKSMVQNVMISSLLPDDCTDLIICFPSLISSGINVPDLSSWVASGGHLIIACGLEAEEIVDPLFPEQDWCSLLGISERKSEDNVPVDSMIMLSSLLSGACGMEFSDDVVFCEAADVELLQSCTVHIATADDFKRPLLWDHDYEAGHVLICNADLMDNKTNRGMIVSCFAQMDTALVYPVINASVYCIDDFPSVAPAGFDKNVLDQFGYTVEDFYANIWWPSMQKIATQYGIRYSTFLIQCYEANVQGPFSNTNNQPSATYYTKLLLEMGGELGLHGYNHQPLVLEGYVFDEKNGGYTCWNTVENMLDSIKAALAYANTLSKDVNIQAYVAPSNVLGPEAMSAMIRQFEDIRIYAGVYIGTADQLVQEFSVLKNNVVLVPRLTADMQMESSEWWLQVNEMNYHYYESNFIHPDDILDEERSDGGDFTAMVEAYESMVQWNQKYGLRTATISEAAGAVQRYCNLSVSQELDDGGVSLHIDGLIDEAYLMLRTKETPVSISSGEITKIDDGCYLLHVKEPNFRVNWGLRR